MLAWALASFLGASLALAEEPPTPPDGEARSTALRQFQGSVHAVYARNLARAGLDEQAAADAQAQKTARPTAASEAAEGEEAGAQRIRLRSVLDHLSVSATWQVEQEHWRAGIRLRYARSVEFDPETETFALIESTELTPAARYWALQAARTTRTVVRRTGYDTWEHALFAVPSRWAFFDRPNVLEEALRVEPGTEITASNETTIFVGVDDSTNLGKWPLGFRAGPFRSGEFFVRLSRLPKSLVRGNREWVLSLGGQVPEGFEFATDLRTPEILWGRHFKVFETSWRVESGVRFVFRAGPVDLETIPDAERFFAHAVGGAAIFRFRDLDLFGMDLRKSEPLEERFGLLERLEVRSGFRDMLASASGSPEPMPWSGSLSHFEPRRAGEFHIGARAAVYGMDFTTSAQSAESLGTRSYGAPFTILEFPLQRRSDRGWLLFPRETHDLRMVTVMDAAGDDLFTEVSFELNDARAHPGERRKYGAQIERVLTSAVAKEFPTVAVDALQGATAVNNVLPDLRSFTREKQKVSIYLRLILGPTYHDRLRAEAKDAKDLRHRTTEWQERIAHVIRKPGDDLERLIAAYGADDLFVSYRIAVTPRTARDEPKQPTVLYTGAYGTPGNIRSYWKLRRAFDEGGTGF